MYDIFPFPNITATSIPELVTQTNNYLIQFKEILEFALANISTDNLSQDLIEKLNILGADIEKSIEDRDDQMQQVANKALSVSDVINSLAFSLAVDSAVDKAVDTAIPEKVSKIQFSVNFSTGNLEYITS